MGWRYNSKTVECPRGSNIEGHLYRYLRRGEAMTRPTKKLPTCRRGCCHWVQNWSNLLIVDTCEGRKLPKKGVPHWCPIRRKGKKI